MYSTRYSCQILNKLGFPPQIFENSSNAKFHETSPSGSRVVPCGQTRRTDKTRLLITFRNFTNAAKNITCFTTENRRSMPCERADVSLHHGPWGPHFQLPSGALPYIFMNGCIIEYSRYAS